MVDSNKPSDLLRSDIRSWLGAPDPSINQNMASRKCHEATGSWFVHGSQFFHWKDRPNSFLWLHGFVGCGKTILCSTVISNIRKHTASVAKTVLAFYYFDFSNQIKAQASSCLRSIVLQLAQRSRDITALENLHRVYTTSTPPTNELLEVLRYILQSFQRVYIVVDALDECTDQEELFDIIETVRSWRMDSLCILVTSRDEPNVRNALDLARDQEVPLQNSAVDKDITLSIAETLGKDPKLQDWSDMFPEIEASLTEGAKGMFRWVECQLETLRGCPSRAEVRKALNELPENLDQTYERILRRVPQKYCDYTLRVLQWLCIADRPILVDHMMTAFAANIGDDPRVDLDSRFESTEKVLGLCPGFVVKNSTTEFGTWPHKTLRPCFQIAHYSVKEYLLSNLISPPPDQISMFKVNRGLANPAMAKTCLVFALHAPEVEFALSARNIWQVFFRNAKEEPQLTALAIRYLMPKAEHGSLNTNYSAVMKLATREGLNSIIVWLVEHCRTKIDISDALFRVCSSMYRSIEIVKLLAEHGAAVDGFHYEDDVRYDSTPLHAAAQWKDIPLVRTLIHLGADPRKEDCLGITPLLTAVRTEDDEGLPLELIKLLWCHGSSSSHDSDNRNTLYWVVSGYDHGPRTEEVAQWLVHHGVNPHEKNIEGYTALHQAARRENETAIRLLSTVIGKHAENDGCLITYLQSRWITPRLSIARQICAVDPRPFGDFRNGAGSLSSFLLARFDKDDPFLRVFRPQEIDEVDPRLRLFRPEEIDAVLLRNQQDHSFTTTDLYVQFFSLLLKVVQPDDREVASWLAMELKARDLTFFGTELWKVALGWFSNPVPRNDSDADGHAYDGVSDENLRVIRTLFTKREIFGVGMTQLHRFLHQESRGRRKWIAETLVREEPACVLAGPIDNQGIAQGFGHLSGKPLHHAAKGESLTLFTLILSAGADPNEQDENGNTTLFFAIIGPQFGKTVRSLLELGCNINHQNNMGLTPLAYYISEGWPNFERNFLQFLLQQGCDMNIGDTAGRTPLMRAAALGMHHYVHQLVQEGCHVNVQDEGLGVLHVEGIAPHWPGRQKRVRRCGGYTALMYGVLFTHIDIVESLLLHEDCDAHLRNNESHTAMDLAMMWEEDEIVQILENHEGGGWETLSDADST